ncbi:transcription factor [Ganoderma sinense ZZ0214-1]|uniref:Transcription factor n=1 Tax=Ganoderma sinense ZZ0214-1 TaxID=1077348 RepID=A0A2G8S375_9APHY|nr:transcription factor [Ganoderma sinense ZZ0214-1]
MESEDRGGGLTEWDINSASSLLLLLQPLITVQARWTTRPSIRRSRGSSSPPRPSRLPPSSISIPFRETTPFPHLPAPRRFSLPPPTYTHPSLSSTASPLSGHALSASSTLPWSNHRASSSRDDIPPPSRRLSESSPHRPDREMARDSSQDRLLPSSHVKHEAEDSMPSTSDFVKKLYKMLEDTTFADVVSWGPNGDCFVVKDMNEFTKSILPRMFKHSNFASFVRQLNKYDFHKVKNTDDNQFGEHSWTFRHPDFHADRRDALENIKRKVPAQRKSTGRSANSPSPSSSATVEALQAQLDRMARDQEEMAQHIRSLETNYQNVLSEMVNFQRNMAQQDGLMQNLIQYFLQLENGGTVSS